MIICNNHLAAGNFQPQNEYCSKLSDSTAEAKYYPKDTCPCRIILRPLTIISKSNRAALPAKPLFVCVRCF